ncbi:MAG: GNAT family N-acetyltransferase [Clostridiaceae bacterium]
MEYRRARAEDFNQIITLVNKSFNEEIPMEIAFPFLFHKSNDTSFVAVDNGECISFIGGVPYKLKAGDKEEYCINIGAVCTKEGFRGKGIADKLLKRALLDYKSQGLSFALISGDGSLYLKNHFTHFGEFLNYEIRDFNSISLDRESQYVISSYQKDMKSLCDIYNLYSKKDKAFLYSLNEMKILLDASAACSVMKLKQKVYLAHVDGLCTAFIVVGIKDQGDRVGRVIEAAGAPEGIIYLIKAIGLMEGLSKVDFIINKRDLELQKYLQRHKVSEINNEGTYLPFYTDIEREDIPYTLNLNFV